MGEVTSSIFPVTFNKSLRVETRTERLSSDGGVIVLREIDQRLQITQDLVRNLRDPRDPNTTIHPLIELIRTRIYLIAQGWNDANDADSLRHDPAFVTAVSQKKGQTPLKPNNTDHRMRNGLASQPTLSRLTEILTSADNRYALQNNLIESARKSINANRKHRYQRFTIDLDSLPIMTYGHQYGSVYNGYYQYTCFHPFVAMLAETGHILDIKLRPGNVHSADGLSDFLFPLIDDVQGKIGIVASVRGDAAMPSEDVMSELERRRIGYVFRLKTNAVLKRLAEPYLNLDPEDGFGDRVERTVELSYQAESWSRPRRLVLVIVENAQGDLFEPYNYFFLITDWSENEMSGFELMEFYRQRGTMERWIGEFKDVFEPALSCSARPRQTGNTVPKFRDDLACNEVLLLLYASAYNLLNTARRLMEKATKEGWSLRRFREQVLKIAIHFTLHARRIQAWITRSAAELWLLLGLRITKLHPI